ncbi:adhesion G protein-coupled receptor B3-like [Dreissena polymorpha]|uniref:adhesion G protein-coupled receptor B3-like n=1 Tax=Dreissena polymorpha TaxID=45954 RepID=UPI002264AEB5|nr:adhesion G protein-coupled receptor B3-like [Dreissena polymorpha]
MEVSKERSKIMLDNTNVRAGITMIGARLLFRISYMEHKTNEYFRNMTVTLVGQQELPQAAVKRRKLAWYCDATPKTTNGYFNAEESKLLCNACDLGYRLYQYSSGDMRCLLYSELKVVNTIERRVRLAGGGSHWGRVEVFYGDEWGTVCDDAADDQFASVLCRELGMDDGKLMNLLEVQLKIFSGADSYIWLDDVQCTGNESSIVDCAHSGWGVHDCDHSEDIGVLCYANDCRLQVQNGGKNKVGASTLYGSFATFTCNNGYRTSQNLTTGGMRCMPDGNWEAARCEKTGHQKVDNTVTNPAPAQCQSNTDFNGIEWGAVYAGNVTLKNCTDGYTGIITRTCNAHGYFENPIYNCTKQAIHALLNKVKVDLSADVKDTIKDLRKEISLEENNTSEKTTLHVGDIETATEIMKLITDRFEAHNSTIKYVTDSFIDVVDNLISDRTTHSWGALLDKGGAATVINVLDEFISKVVNNSAVLKQNMTVRKDNIFLQIGSVEQCSKIKFPDSGKNGNVPEWAITRHDTVEVACREKGGLTFSGSLFRNMTSIMSSKTKDSKHMEINAPVLAFSMYDSITTSDAQNVTLIFELFNTDLTKPSCSFWEKGYSSGEGFWSSEGCKLVEYNQQTGRVTCSCNHLTNFAVLMSRGVTVEKIHHQTLSAITVVGCCLSLAGLVTTSVIYVYCWRMVKSNRATLLLNLCAALFVAYLAFLIGIKRTQSLGTCKFTAVLLHYVYLVAFFLMLAEGGVIALMVLSPLTKRDSVPYFLAGAYGIPAVIVGVSMVATQLDGYGNDRFCWLSVESGLFWAFAGPVLAIVVTNLIILVLVLKQLFGVAAMSKKTDAEKVK